MRFGGWELTAAVASCLVSLGLVPLIGGWARRRRLLDLPTTRSAHRDPKPRLGGLGVVAAMAVGVIVSLAAPLAGLGSLFVMLLLGAIVGLVSLVDDLRGLPALPRLAVHVLVASAATVWIGSASRVFLPGDVIVSLGAFGAVVTACWIVLFVNAFNFMDGVDGIAGAQALAAGLVWVGLGWSADAPVVGWAGAIAAGAALGFLQYNWQPSSIFLGDVGATFLGFWLAAIPLLSGQPDRFLLPAVFVVWPFVVDVIFTLAMRVRRGEYLFAGHQQHVYQRLVAKGWSHSHVALLYAALSGIGGIVAIGLVRGDQVVTAAGLTAVALSALTVQVLLLRPGPGAGAARPGLPSDVQLDP
jgi:UDP-N-acetylmuramyl pentapeptide phosphotransferase/UDP-N-acetylglucosamine-1-phosphate transferase